MAYGYSEFTQIALNVYTSDSLNVQLPPIKLLTSDAVSDDDEAPTGIYIHSLVQTNAFSALTNDADEESTDDEESVVINGWSYQYDYSETDFLRKSLDDISAFEPLNVTTVFTTLTDNKINLPAILKLGVEYRPDTMQCGPGFIRHDNFWHQTISNSGHTLVYKQTIPGLIFEFDRNNKFIAIIAQPLEETQNNLRAAYVSRLFEFLPDSVDFSNFKRYVDEDTEKYVDKPCALVYDNVAIHNKYIHKTKTMSSSSGMPSHDIRNKDALLIEFMNSPWVSFDLTTAIGQVHQFFNVDHLTDSYIPHDPRYNLPTIYVTTVANAFNVSLNTYKAIADDGDVVLVVPEPLLREMNENVISIWLGVNSI